MPDSASESAVLRDPTGKAAPPAKTNPTQPRGATLRGGTKPATGLARAKPVPAAAATTSEKTPPPNTPKKAALETAPPAKTENKPATNAVTEASTEPKTRGAAYAGWPVSMVLHAIALVLLGLVATDPPKPPPAISSLIASTAQDDTLEDLPEVEIKPEEMDSQQTDFSADPGAADFQSIAAETSAAVQPTDATGPEHIDIGETFGVVSKGDLMREISGDGGKGAATFYGVKSTGRKFCFVVDNSASMLQGRFEAALSEIMASVENMQPNQQFYVVFFSDTAYPLFYPNTAPNWVAATKENKYKLSSWLAQVPMCWKTQGEKAMETAFALRPDVIYLLGDGAFTDKTVSKTLAYAEPRVTIHTLGFDLKGNAADSFQKIATAYRGTFRDVKVPPQMVELEKRNKRPRYQTRNGVWCITIPAK